MQSVPLKNVRVRAVPEHRPPTRRGQKLQGGGALALERFLAASEGANAVRDTGVNM
jgi:hypothetical protein